MKVRAISTVVVNARMRNWVFVKVETDEPGLTGWGEASLEWNTQAVVGAVEDLAVLVVGEDPRRTEHLWQVMYRQHFFKGGVVTMSAISGIDQALHDIKAKALGIPLYELLGGAVRDRVRMYDHLGGGDSEAVYNDATAEHFAERAHLSVESGFTALKILAVPRSQMLEGAAAIREAVTLMSAVRQAVGEDVDVMVDLHGRTTPAMAIQYGHALAEYRPWFLEEPCQPENVDAMAEVARALPIPIATGERLVTRFQFRELLEKRACAVIQPDVCHCGGVSEIKKIAAMAETYYVSMAPHNPLGPIATMVNIHVGFSTPTFLIQEVMRLDVPWRNDVVDAELPIEGGHVSLPRRAGIGIEVNEKEAAKHPFKPETQVRLFHPDGSVADW
ncbi:MAG TPA: galactonate dehydratase [Chloroflexota bacterium]